MTKDACTEPGSILPSFIWPTGRAGISTYVGDDIRVESRLLHGLKQGAEREFQVKVDQVMGRTGVVEEGLPDLVGSR